MKLFKYFVCAYYTLCLILSVYSKENLIWYRIPQFYVTESVNNFLNQHKINNCFYKFEDDYTLLLKCWRNNQLVDVSINIKHKHKHKNFYYSLSI
jgi:hypothetical protein